MSNQIFEKNGMNGTWTTCAGLSHSMCSPAQQQEPSPHPAIARVKWNMIDYISAYKSQIALKGVDFVADTPRINAKLRVMMAAFADAFQNRCS